MHEETFEKALTESKTGTYINIEVHPNSKKIEIKYNEWKNAIEVKIKSPPKGGKANKELVTLFSELLKCEVTIAKGEKSRSKVLFAPISKEKVKEVLSRFVSN